jgi:hypothetical protein
MDIFQPAKDEQNADSSLTYNSFIVNLSTLRKDNQFDLGITKIKYFDSKMEDS